MIDYVEYVKYLIEKNKKKIYFNNHFYWIDGKKYPIKNKKIEFEKINLEYLERIST